MKNRQQYLRGANYGSKQIHCGQCGAGKKTKSKDICKIISDDCDQPIYRSAKETSYSKNQAWVPEIGYVEQNEHESADGKADLHRHGQPGSLCI